MGKKGSSGSGGQAQQVPIPAGLYQTIASTSGLGGYASSLLDPLASMTNWAANLASGGHAGQIPSFASQATVAGPNTIFGGRGGAWASSFDPRTGLITFTWPGDPSRSFQSDIAGARGRTDIPSSTLDQWQADAAAHQGGAGAGSTAVAGLPATSSQFPATISVPQWQDWYNQNIGKTIYVGGQLQTIGSGSGQMGPDALLQASQNNQVSWGAPDMNTALGPFLGSAWNAIQAQQSLPGQMAPIEARTASLDTQATQQATDLFNRAGPMYDEAGNMIAKGDTMLSEATTGTGLFPSQASYIEEIKRTGETESAAMLSKLGLSESTMSPALKEQADLAAAGKAGELIQGNISAAEEEQKVGQAQLSAAQQQVQLSQASQKIALGAQALELGEQQAVFDMFTSIANESTAFQRNLWDEALSGYGALGNIIQTAGQQYGYSLSGYKTVVEALSASAQNQAELQKSQMQQDSQSTSSMFGALGKILGGVGGAVGGAAAGGSSAAGGVTSIIGSVIGLVGSLFCWVAREALNGDARWILFRDWMLNRASSWLRDAYSRYGEGFATYISTRPVLKAVVKGMILGTLESEKIRIGLFRDLVQLGISAFFCLLLALNASSIGNFLENMARYCRVCLKSIREVALPYRS